MYYLTRSQPIPGWWYRRWSLIVVLVFLLGLSLLPVVPPPSSIADNKLIQPELLQQALAQPTAKIGVIIQKQLSGSRALEEAVTQLGGTITKDLHIINAFAVQIPARAIPQLSGLSGLRWASLDSPTINPSVCNGCVDSYDVNNTYNFDIRADKVWNKTVGGVQQPWLQGNGVGVAVLDSGLNPSFKDFGSRRVVAQQNFNSNTTNPADVYGHATHVAGIIGGNGANSNGAYVGIAPQVNLVSVKVSDDNGMSTASDVVSGLQWINDNRTTYNIRVVNISLNSSVKQSYNLDPLDAAAEILWFNGIVVVVSSGNSGSADLYPPANDPFVITVGAIDDLGTTNIPNDIVASFSSYGKDELGNIKPDLVAPGKNIISVGNTGFNLEQNHPANVVNNNYFKMSGTSTAAPMVAGAVALLLQSEPNLNPDQVKYRLKATALQNIARGSWDTRIKWTNYNSTKAGAGYLDIYAAVSQIGITATANTGLPASQMLWTGSAPLNWSSVNWSSVNWSTVNWSTVNWSTVNWSTVNWSSDYWGP